MKWAELRRCQLFDISFLKKFPRHRNRSNDDGRSVIKKKKEGDSTWRDSDHLVAQKTSNGRCSTVINLKAAAEDLESIFF